MNLLLFALVFWIVAWALNEWLVRRKPQQASARRLIDLAVPLIFGLTLLVIWESVSRGLNIPPILLPPPSMIWERIINSLPILWADFRQTFLKAVIAGYVLGCGSGFIVALLIDRSPFLQRGLLPLGNFVSALPIIGIAPIMVMWFGFDWQSKAAVVLITLPDTLSQEATRHDRAGHLPQVAAAPGRAYRRKTGDHGEGIRDLANLDLVRVSP